MRFGVLRESSAGDHGALSAPSRFLLTFLICLTVVQQFPPVQTRYYEQVRGALFAGFAVLVIGAVILGQRFLRGRLLSRFSAVLAWVGLVVAAKGLLSGTIVTAQLVLLLIPFGVLLCSLGIPFTASGLRWLLAGYAGLVLAASSWNVLEYVPELTVSSMYAVPYKNQIGPMIGIAAIIVIVAMMEIVDAGIRHRFILVFGCGCVLLILWMNLALIRNRAGLLASVVVGAVICVGRVQRWSRTRAVLLPVIAAWIGAVLLATGYLVDILSFVYASFTANYDVADLDSLSAGRVDVYRDAWAFVREFPAFGELNAPQAFDAVPHNYVLNVLVRFGIVGSFPLILFHIYLWSLAVQGASASRRGSMASGLSAYLLLFSLIVAQFEYTYPFGPGVSQVMIWFILGQPQPTLHEGDRSEA